MPTELTLRPATPGDLDDLVSVHVSSRAAAPMPAGVHPEREVRAWLTERLDHDEVWVAVVGDEVAAYTRFTETWLDDLYVAPERAGQGLGSALLGVVKARRPGGFCLWVFETNQPARGFYAHHGLVELERTDGTGNEEKQPDIRMAWPGDDPLAFYRGLIDEVDADLGDVLARRAALTRAVQPHKPVAGRDPDRERAIAEAMARRAPALGADRLHRIVHAIITESLEASQA
ncbi:GNAT family N-acetyltransferase [Nocardioides sp.]|uniref:GNAT family N-acetyltransferase n=1 Tax=Nocardioides sp. TaxID=35761 RepID=UPI001A2D271C|nr:GNAT family N-acetyltransferase [Nocardioides sp.]MBJ7357922.1 GNAT family N-acetyltransferase [Nocardioides sp.]